MLLRKINAGISLLITFLVLYHAISIAPWILTGFVLSERLPYGD